MASPKKRRAASRPEADAPEPAPKRMRGTPKPSAESERWNAQLLEDMRREEEAEALWRQQGYGRDIPVEWLALEIAHSGVEFADALLALPVADDPADGKSGPSFPVKDLAFEAVRASFRLGIVLSPAFGRLFDWRSANLSGIPGFAIPKGHAPLVGWLRGFLALWAGQPWPGELATSFGHQVTAHDSDAAHLSDWIEGFDRAPARITLMQAAELRALRDRMIGVIRDLNASGFAMEFDERAGRPRRPDSLAMMRWFEMQPRAERRGLGIMLCDHSAGLMQTRLLFEPEWLRFTPNAARIEAEQAGYPDPDTFVRACRIMGLIRKIDRRASYAFDDEPPGRFYGFIRSEAAELGSLRTTDLPEPPDYQAGLRILRERLAAELDELGGSIRAADPSGCDRLERTDAATVRPVENGFQTTTETEVVAERSIPSVPPAAQPSIVSDQQKGPIGDCALILPENRSKPLSLGKAGLYYGIEGDEPNRRKQMKDLIREKTLRTMFVSARRRHYDMSQFPPKYHDKMKP